MSRLAYLPTATGEVLFFPDSLSERGIPADGLAYLPTATGEVLFFPDS